MISKTSNRTASKTIVINSLGITACTLAASLLFTTGCNTKPESPNTPTPSAATPAAAPGQPTTEAKKNPVTITPDADTNNHAFTTNQILTCTVSQCWQLSGKSEDIFFDIVQQLAVISAKNRDLALPQTEAAGQKTGEFIKAQARKDHDQLLYAVVDAAIRKVGTPNQAN